MGSPRQPATTAMLGDVSFLLRHQPLYATRV
jgi:hypothetical protein